MANWMSDVASEVLGIASNLTAKTSNWGSINPNLIAVFTQVGLDGKPTGLSFKALVKDGTLEQSFNWQSPFEDMTAEQKHPTLMAAAQTGNLAAVTQVITGDSEEQQGGITSSIQEFAKGAVGRSGITKLNSRQVYTGHEPLKIDMTLIFRAWQDPYSEVAQPYDALLQMAYPAKMAEYAGEEIVNGNTDGVTDAALAALFPSETPKLVTMTYKGETYQSLVIESISKPLDAPYSPMGDLFLEIPITLATLESLDYEGVAKIRSTKLGNRVTEAINKTSTLFK